MDTQNIYDFMHNLPIDGSAVNVDACTITATGLDGKLTINMILDELKPVLEIETRKPFKFNGAEGFMAGSVRYADKWNEKGQKLWAILMVTGERSRQVLSSAVIKGDVKFTRVDLCVDVMMRERVFSLPRKLYDSYKGDCKVKLIESLVGDTLYCGSRESESMIRLYDKSSEYGTELGYVWRFEVEYKGDLAGLVASDVAKCGDKVIEEFVWGECRSKHLPSPKVENRPNIKNRRITLSSAEMKLNWLERQVAPTVRHLRSLGLENEVITALQLDLPLT